MRILLTTLPVTRRECPPYELAMTAAVLRSHGHETVALDLNNEVFHKLYRQRKLWKYTKYDLKHRRLRDAGPHLQDFQLGPLRDRILGQRPELVVFKSGTLNVDTTAAVARMLKNANPSLPLVFTGRRIVSQETSGWAGSSAAPFDCIIWGEDDVALPKLLDGLGGPCRGESLIEGRSFPVANLDDLPFHDFSDYPLSQYGSPGQLEFRVNRGCTWDCRFCIEWLLDGKYRTMSGKRIFEEFRHQSLALPSVNRVRFDDPSLNADMQVLTEFARLMKEQRPPLSICAWLGQAMLRSEMTFAVLRLLREGGCIQLNYGLESGSERVLADMGKRFSLEVAEEVIRNTHLNSIICAVNLVIGFPTERRADFAQTIAFVKRNRAHIHHVATAFVGCRIEKGSFLDRHQERFGLTSCDVERWETRDGQNTYRERVDRFRELCEACIEMGLPVGAHGRWIRNSKNLADVLEEISF
ncbi:MAG: radical SAM protein [Elusimicrobia bacterium]|nr:radical SAM protein [Elusimicrobiota bacterium]